MNYHLLFYIYLLLNNGPTLSSTYDWTFMPRLQELCPYTSFCEENATMTYLIDDAKQPCCESCSCKPDCEKDNNCCFSEIDTRRKCMAATVNTKSTGAHYMMIHSYLVNSHVAENMTMCLYDDTNYKSFAPVVSEESKDIFVNLECALSNKVYDTIPWELAVNCLMDNIKDNSYDVVRLVNGEEVSYDGCYLGYVPPKHLNLESQECRNVIRECNISQKALEWEPLWDYCPILNAPFLTFDKVYGNIFCFLCNEGSKYGAATTCLNWEDESPFRVPFAAILDVADIIQLDSQTVLNESVRRPTETIAHSFQTENRRVECPSGQIRQGGKCKFYSKQWIGGPFIAVLKLIPLDKTTKIDVSVISKIRAQSELQNGTKSSWLKRKAMEHWIVRTLLYRPSVDEKCVDYFVAFTQFPSPTANPSRLMTALQRTLNETWLLTIKNTTVPLQVQFNKHLRYQILRNNNLKTKGIFIDQEYGYLNAYSSHRESEEMYLLEVYHTKFHNSQEPTYLNELFLCNQTRLTPEEYEEHIAFIVLQPMNEVLFEAEYTAHWFEYYVCLDRFRLNKGLSNVPHVLQEVIIALYVYLLQSILLTV